MFSLFSRYIRGDYSLSRALFGTSVAVVGTSAAIDYNTPIEYHTTMTTVQYDKVEKDELRLTLLHMHSAAVNGILTYKQVYRHRNKTAELLAVYDLYNHDSMYDLYNRDSMHSFFRYRDYTMKQCRRALLRNGFFLSWVKARVESATGGALPSVPSWTMSTPQMLTDVYSTLMPRQ